MALGQAEVQETLQRAVALHRQGDLANAERLYERILASAPAQFDALRLLGLIALQTGRSQRCAALLYKAIKINPRFAPLYVDRGIALRNLNRLNESLASLNKAIALNGDFPGAHNNRGVVLNDLKRFNDALASYDRAISLNPGFAEAHYNRGDTLRNLGRFADAIDAYGLAIAVRPNYVEAHNNRGLALLELRRYEEAIASFDIAIALRPNEAQAYSNRGGALGDIGRLDEALADLDKAIALSPDFAESHSSRGNVLHNLGRFDDALASFDRATLINPDYADAHWNRSLSLLATGQFESGWRLYEWRKKKKGAVATATYRQPQWTGAESLSGKTIFLCWEQGLGDTIQFARYATLFEPHGARVVMSVQDPLASLLARLGPRIDVIGQDMRPKSFDYHCPLMSLPGAFGTTLETIPSADGYLSADAARKAAWANRLQPKDKLRIGLAWSGRSGHKYDRNRSIGIDRLRPLLTLDAQWVCLQKELREGDAAVLRELGDIPYFGESLADFEDTAALIEQLDLVISVDTSVAHLAGALGKAVWILLPFNAEWRWLIGRADSPWYASARLFRQPRIGDWSSVIAQAKMALESELRRESVE